MMDSTLTSSGNSGSVTSIPYHSVLGTTSWNNVNIYPSLALVRSSTTPFTPNKVVIGQAGRVFPIDFTNFQWTNSYSNMTGLISISQQTNAV
jgi:hypothetical protein